MAIPSLLTIKQFSGKHPAFPEGGLRFRIFNADKNGMADAGVIIRNGRRVLIDEERFFGWLEAKNKRVSA